jgi:integrase
MAHAPIVCLDYRIATEYTAAAPQRVGTERFSGTAGKERSGASTGGPSSRISRREALAGTHQGKRNLATIQALRYTGIRVGKLVSLTREDLEISERKGSLTIRSGKGGQFREVPLNVEVRRALADCLEVRPVTFS